MNIFVLDLDPKTCAQYHVNRHTTKMCVEYAQLLCSVHWSVGSELSIPYRLTHKNHPCAIWTRECIENYRWLCQLALELCIEYTHRYGRRHKSQNVIEWAIDNEPKLNSIGFMTSFALAMPDKFRIGDATQSYRTYYSIGKRAIAVWKNRVQPSWFI